MKLKKSYEIKELKKLKENGKITIKRDYSNDTHGTGGRGYYERKGILINDKTYQVVYSSAGYGRVTADIIDYNGRILEKHYKYKSDVKKHFNEYIKPLLSQ